MKQFLLYLVLLPLPVLSQSNDKTCETLAKINALVKENHFQPKPVDDSLSVFVFDKFIDGLDSNRNIFTKVEYEKLRKHRLLIDNYIAENNCSFMNDFVSTYKLALERKRSVIEKLETVALDYNSKDSVKFSKEQFPFDLNENDFDRVWKKRLRFDILEDISKLSKNSDSLQKHFSEIEKTVKKKIFDTNLCKVNAILNNKNGLDGVLKNDFLNAFCNYFDPHSNYFSFDAKSSFLSGLSTSNLSLGIDVSMNENDEIVIAEIVPGGPASRNEKIEIGDIVTKVSNTKGEEYWVSCSSMETIGDLIFSDTNKQIQLTLRKKNGATVDVLVKKKVMKATANAVYSFIAEKETKVGYIKIPNFYADFDGKTMKGCADDVAKEIVKLKKDKIDGLVIDLQNNGGGSMAEAIKLAGMFINVGPISVLVDNNHNQNIIKDFNRGEVYDGPIVILINGYSASASEFFAAALQDYNRAVIVGSTSLGKASMQTIMPLEEDNENDFVKLTIEKFYRISGESHQIKGIVPDVSTPVLFDSLIKREDSFETALPYDAITTRAKYNPLPNTFNSEIFNLSKTRIENDLRFKEMKSINEEINLTYNKPRNPVRLTFADVFKEVHDIDSLWEKVKSVTEKENSLTISNTSYDKEKFAFDEFQKEINTFKMKDVKTNPYLEEAINIINDYKKFKQ
ncbi:carboxyl-terminal processing protease [Flavobacterium arsenatis]|uniref:Carboxyl-terminal processing protease n=1 Tax=Flavobacterium arsenatis TaxID=1484332 RepID=A0ABU1TQ37_9FLAO|nr:carboxy terminal-processing peptidase [Flavobacterium arsenatis]MDR6968074.1 carboxyl-terminal processing protease [Flavobacterium arsenatis]